jgi:hypothetical protein
VVAEADLIRAAEVRTRAVEVDRIRAEAAVEDIRIAK